MERLPHPGDGKGPGRPKGSPNKVPASIKEMVLDALNNKGGVSYLEQQADLNATSFMTLIGKIIPTQISNADDETFKIEQSLKPEDKIIIDRYLNQLKEKK